MTFTVSGHIGHSRELFGASKLQGLGGPSAGEGAREVAEVRGSAGEFRKENLFKNNHICMGWWVKFTFDVCMSAFRSELYSPVCGQFVGLIQNRILQAFSRCSRLNLDRSEMIKSPSSVLVPSSDAPSCS